ncbi:MAG TPA: glycoside hydrolase family 2 TIM barrel-domain containing protein [Planctomycetaceae bacterium]|jgi:beta-galactosidase/beta-glucuronidase|nr:glycoside hydrolase family 2 TIM barrel-domain containing protein [Planctomycetaceae bacterium]
MMHRLVVSSICVGSLLVTSVFAADWKPAAGPLMTRWAKDVTPATAHREYPRPQLVRTEWENLNGLWDYAIKPRGDERPAAYEGSILVPFPVESALSGVMRRVGPDNRLWYRRTVTVPKSWMTKRVLLHFDAVDWEATVWLDGKQVGVHRGGYSPFTFDVTEQLAGDRPHELVVGVWDPSDAGTQPRGKQQNKPQGIWYTPSSGIWQTVWLEPVVKTHLQDLAFQPGGAPNTVLLTVNPTDAPGELPVEVEIFDRIADSNGNGAKIGSNSGTSAIPMVLTVPSDSTTYWTPDTPQLYGATIKLLSADRKQVLDEVQSYFALRMIDVLPSGNDQIARIRLNNRPVFLIGPLDQGFWPDGLYTAPTDEALRSDLETTKRLGFNMVRKHVKVEPARWYYWCDRLGLVVFQDMPSGDRSAPETSSTKAEITRSPESTQQYETELLELIASRRQFPCIIGWVPFNEGWGQFDTAGVVRTIRDHDTRRLVTPASGWNDFPVGNIHDIHSYPGPAAPKGDASRAAMLGEFGGLGLPIPDHLWVTGNKNWGYRKYKTRDELTAAYLDLTTKLAPLVQSRLSAAVYTQTTDVETEVNGLMTYDRAVIKMDPDKLYQANRGLIELSNGLP